MIKIDLLLPQDVYPPGYLLQGTVVLQADDHADFESLEFSCTWTNPGDGRVIDRQSGQLLRAGKLAPGKERHVPFAVQLPEQSSSDLRLDDLRWELRAELRLPDRDNAVAIRQFEVALRRAREAKIASKFFGGGTSKEAKAQAARTAPATLGDAVGGLFISLFFGGLVAGGAGLVFNGFPHRVLPSFVPWFGVVCILGGLFVLQKIWDGLYPAFGRGLLAALTGGIALLGGYAAVVEPGFSILRGPQAGAAHPSIDHLGSPYGQLAWLMAVAAGVWLAHTLSTRREREPSVVTAFILIGVVAVGLAVAAFVSPQQLPFTTEIYIAGALGAVALGIAASLRDWRRPSGRFALVVIAMPLLLAAGLVRMGGTPALAGAGTIAFLVALYAFFTLRSLASEAWIGTPNLRLVPGKPHPGGEVGLEIDFLPRKNATVRDIRATLICTYHYNGAAPDDNDSERVSRQALKGMFPVKLVAGQALTVPLSTVLALDAPRSSTGSSSYSWELQVVIDVAGAPDWEDVVAVEVG
jgi:hypothetical protein